MIRHDLALDAAESQVSIHVLATSFLTSVEETMLENKDPASDPAVMLLGAHIAFYTHADVGTKGTYQRLIDSCLTNSTQFSIGSRSH